MKHHLSARRIFRIIDEANEIKTNSLAISGGEPLIRDDCLRILSYATKRVKTVLATNRILIDKHVARVLVDLDIDLQVSLDGPQESIHDFIRGKGAYAKTMEAIDLMSRLGAASKISLCVTVSKNNIDHIQAIFKLALEKGISSIRFIPIQNMGIARSHWDTLSVSTQDYTDFYTYLYHNAPSQFPELRISQMGCRVSYSTTHKGRKCGVG